MHIADMHKEYKLAQAHFLAPKNLLKNAESPISFKFAKKKKAA